MKFSNHESKRPYFHKTSQDAMMKFVAKKTSRVENKPTFHQILLSGDLEVPLHCNESEASVKSQARAELSVH
jgi:hypothetical protein